MRVVRLFLSLFREDSNGTQHTLVLDAGSVWKLTFAGCGYQITSTHDGKTVRYMVTFGGGQLFDQYTAFDPVSKNFVYLEWPRDQKTPKPVGAIWDDQTGQTLDLYQFPGVKHPLPVRPSIMAMKVCPLTGDKDFKVQESIAID